MYHVVRSILTHRSTCYVIKSPHNAAANICLTWARTESDFCRGDLNCHCNLVIYPSVRMKPFQRQTFERNMFQSNCTSADRCANYNCLRKLVPPAKRGCFIVFQHANSECERKDNGRRYFFRVNPIDKNLLFYLRAATWAMRPAAQQRPVTFSVWKVQSYPLTCQVHVFLLISTATNFLPKAAV